MIYITGANGWLGLNLIESITTGESSKWGLNNSKIRAFILPNSNKKKLLKFDPNIEIFEGDLLNKNDIIQFLDGCDNGTLFHTAGIIHPKKVKEFDSLNNKATLKLLKVAEQKRIKKTVVISSNSPCGCNKTNLQKDYFNESSPFNPYMGYGKSKMEMEKNIKKEFLNTKLNYTLIRAPWFYGPHQPVRQKIFFDMIKNGKGPIVGDGNNVRSMAYVKNLVQGMVLSATKEISNKKTYWIADENPYTMNHIINTIEELLVNDFDQKCKMKRLKLPFLVGQIAEIIDFSLQFLGIYHQKFHVLSEMNKNIACTIDLAKNELGYKPEFDLKKGMKISLKELYNL